MVIHIRKLLLLAGVLLSVGLFSTALAQDGNDPNQRRRQPVREVTREKEFENLPDAMIDRILKRLEETNPEKAEYLKKLRQEDPQRVRTELWRIMQEDARKRGERMPGGPPDSRTGPRPPRQERRGERGDEERGPMELRERFGDFAKWLEKEYPDVAEKISKLKETDPDLYARQMVIAWKKYRTIFRAADNPKQVEILKQSLALDENRGRILSELKKTDNAEKIQKLTEELRAVVSHKFDVIVKLRQLAYEELLQKLEELKKEINEQKAEIEKRKDTEYKEQSVDERLKELLDKDKKFKWED